MTPPKSTVPHGAKPGSVRELGLFNSTYYKNKKIKCVVS